MAEISRCRTCGGRVRRILIVSRAADLELLKPWARRFDAIQIARAGHTEAENAALQAEIERDYLECGCRAARFAVVATLVGVLAFTALYGRPIGEWPVESWIIAASTIVLVPLAIMLGAIISARLRLVARIRGLQHVLG